MPFKAIRGQTRAIEGLKRSLQHQKTAHAFLFTGPEGVGKQATAWALAQAMNCLRSSDGDACGECSACNKIAHRTHPDVHGIVPEGPSLKIDQLRELWQREINLKAVEGRTKFFILDQAETLTPAAANSILKIVEEPPAEVVIILITTQPFSLLPTLRSRCQEIRFRALEEAVLVPWLQERLSCSLPEAQTWARLSGGRPGEALRMAEPEGRALRSEVLELISRIEPDTWQGLASRLAEWRSELPEVLDLLLSWYRDLLLLSHGADISLLCNQDQLPRLQQTVRGETPASLGFKCGSLLKSMDQLHLNLNVQLLMENLMLELGIPAVVGSMPGHPHGEAGF